MHRELNSELLVREVEGEVIILDVKADRVHQLNAAASLVWLLLEGGRSHEEIVDEFTDRFDVEAARARADLDAVIRSFQERGLARDSWQIG